MRDTLVFLMAPLLVIWGAKDRIIPASHAEDLPDSVRVELFEGAATCRTWKQRRRSTRWCALS